MKTISQIPLTTLLLSFPAGLYAAESIRAVSYNIRYASIKDGPDNWLHRADTVAATIAQHDIAGLQDVTYKQLVELKDKLKDYENFEVGPHPEYPKTRCFFVARKDGSKEDFSVSKCI